MAMSGQRTPSPESEEKSEENECGEREEREDEEPGLYFSGVE